MARTDSLIVVSWQEAETADAAAAVLLLLLEAFSACASSACPSEWPCQPHPFAASSVTPAVEHGVAGATCGTKSARLSREPAVLVQVLKSHTATAVPCCATFVRGIASPSWLQFQCMRTVVTAVLTRRALCAVARLCCRRREGRAACGCGSSCQGQQHQLPVVATSVAKLCSPSSFSVFRLISFLAGRHCFVCYMEEKKF
jgi:hypothetical protein